MSDSMTINPALFPGLTTLRELLDLLARWRDFSDPFRTPEGLRIGLALLEQLGAALGIDSTWLAWIDRIRNTPELFDLVLSLGRYLESLIVAPSNSVRLQARSKRRG